MNTATLSSGLATVPAEIERVCREARPMRILFRLMMVVWALQPAHAQDSNDQDWSSDRDSDRACVMISVYAKMGVDDDKVKALVKICNRNPNPKHVCVPMMILQMAKRQNLGLVCRDPSIARELGIEPQ